MSGVKERRKRDTKDLAGTQEQSAYNVRESKSGKDFSNDKDCLWAYRLEQRVNLLGVVSLES